MSIPANTPSTLPSIDSNSVWDGTHEYRWKSSITGYEVYKLVEVSSGNGIGDIYDIVVDTSTNTWEDLGAGNPNDVTDGTTVQLGSGTGSLSNLYKFTKPTTAYWISSGSGTGTEEVLVENAQMVFYSGITGWRFEQRGYAAGSYQLIGGTVNESWTVSTGSNNLQHHISQIPAGGTYNLKSGTNVLATLTTSADRKKVFCNFW